MGRVRLGVATMSVAMMVGALLVAQPAHAVGADPVRYEQTSVDSTDDSKQVTAVCPNGQTALGGGGQVNAGSGDVILTGIVPDQALTSVTAKAFARSTHLGSWSVTAYVVCHNAGVRSPELVGVVGIQWSAAAECTSPKIVYGTGFEIFNATGSAFVDEVAPDSYLSRVDVHARGTGIGFFSIKAYAICAEPYDGQYPNHGRMQASSSFDAVTPKSATATKPLYIDDYGSWMFSAGGRIDGGGDVHLDGLGPNLALDGAWARATAIPTVPVMVAGRASVNGDDYSVTAFGSDIGSWY